MGILPVQAGSLPHKSNQIAIVPAPSSVPYVESLYTMVKKSISTIKLKGLKVERIHTQIWKCYTCFATNRNTRRTEGNPKKILKSLCELLEPDA
jgi:precorrin-6B methylase 1